jgi:tetratricopeptide (TPR) repeat protein
VLAIRQDRWDDAVADLRRAVALRPGAVAAYINLALAYRRRAEVPPSRACALALAPGGAYPLLALEARKRAAREEAVAVLREAVRRRPNEPRLHHELGQLHLLLDDPEAARADFARAVALAPNGGAASTLAGDLLEVGRLLHRQGKDVEALRAYDGVLTVRPGQSEVHRLRAESLLARRRYAEAGEALDRYLATVPPDAANAARLSAAFTPNYSTLSPQGSRPGASSPPVTEHRSGPGAEAHRPLTPTWGRHRNELPNGSA